MHLTLCFLFDVYIQVAYSCCSLNNCNCMILVDSVLLKKVKNLSTDTCPEMHGGHQWSFPANPDIAPCFLHRSCNIITLPSHDRLSVHTRQSWSSKSSGSYVRLLLAMQ